MQSAGKHVTVAALVLACLVSHACGATTVEGLPRSALVIVTGSGYAGTIANNGFVIGDGTLVVTCDHAAFERSKAGRHRAPMLVSVFSPCLGEACSARVLASDEELDLAVLEVPWKGHPALGLADANGITSAISARVISLCSVIRRLEDWAGAGAEAFQVEEESLPVGYVGVRQQQPQFVALDGIGKLGPGWSGSPILAAGTDAAIGCFASVSGTAHGAQVLHQEAKGATVNHVVRLLGGGFDKSRLCRAEVPLPSPPDAHEACSLALRTAGSMRSGRYGSAEEPVRAFLQLRPDSAYGHRAMGKMSEELGRRDAARASYQRALELDPNSVPTKIHYAQFLTAAGEPNEAQRILEPLGLSGESGALAAVALASLYGAEKNFPRCLQVLEQAVQVHPRNVYLWQQLAATRLQVQGPQVAIEPIARAVELCPERGPFRGGLAQLLEKTGAYDEAETHFRKLLEIEPENPVVYYWLADFLRKHRPQAGDEALQIAEKALGLPPRGGLSRETIEGLIHRIRGQRPSAEP